MLGGTDGNERWTGPATSSRRGLQHLRHDIRRSLPEAGQEGVRVILGDQRETVEEAESVCPV